MPTDDRKKTKAQLIAELQELRQHVDLVTHNDVAIDGEPRFGFARTVDIFRQLLETMGAIVVRMDAGGQIRVVGPNVENVLGLGASDMLGVRGIDLIHPEDKERTGNIFAALLRDGRCPPWRTRVRRPDGRDTHVEVSAVAQVDDEGQRHVLALARDVTAETLAHRAAADSEERHRILSEASRDLITETADGRFTFVSATCSDVLGYEPEELLGTRPRDLFHPEDVDQVRWRYRRATGSRENIKYSDFRLRHKNGSWRWYEGTGVRYRGADGAESVVGTLRDVTERHEAAAEAERMRERMLQAQKLETLGIMAAGIAHDFGNLLTPILGHASLAAEDLAEDAPAKRRVERIRAAAQRAAELTNQMLAYAGGEPLQLDSVDVSKLVGEVSDVLSGKIPAKARVKLELRDGLPPARADGSQVMQVVMNLITNAAEAVENHGGGIAIRTGTQLGREMRARTLVVGDPDPDRRYVYVSVTDTGAGLDPASRERIFDPFYTTKFTGRGLGLAAVLGIVRAHDGCIEMNSKAGFGTRFRVSFRASEESGTSLADVRAAPDLGEQPATVLVADDDEATREFAVETLERAGMRVYAARDGLHAIELLDSMVTSIDALVLDRTMPRLGGSEALDRIRKTRPDLPAVLMSGYSDASLHPLDPRDAVLEKPFLPEALVDSVRKLIAAAANGVEE